MKRPRRATPPVGKRAEALPPVLRAMLDLRDEEIALFDARGQVLYLNARAHESLRPNGNGAEADGGVRSHLVSRGARPTPLRSGSAVLGELWRTPRRAAPTWQECERTAIEAALTRTGGRLAEAARQLGISRTTLWRRLRTATHTGPQ